MQDRRPRPPLRRAAHSQVGGVGGAALALRVVRRRVDAARRLARHVELLAAELKKHPNRSIAVAYLLDELKER